MAKVTSIFKFRPFNIKTIELLIRREIWFAKPNTLNDPFDCAFEPHDFFENRDENLELSPEVIKKKNKELQDKFSIPKTLEDERSQHPRSFKGDGYRMGICSFSCTRNNQLL